MRIQHNIMAMNAYRNYTNNVSAMKSNLEKLSSGYKINRAGDDAAGLAISEKMRAQITGLQTAQKNAKDGISLVQTAEGALTEVHDMLNRMVELATQSANGTYDNETDRNQLQKEVDQLKSEINRIADSANFNGIKLLDGSMAHVDGTAAIPGTPGTPGTPGVPVDTIYNGSDRILESVIGKGEQAWEVAGNKSVLDGAAASAQNAKFEVDLATMNFNRTETYTMKAGSNVTMNLSVTTASGATKAATVTIKASNAAVQGKQFKAGDTFTVTASSAGAASGSLGKVTMTVTVGKDGKLYATNIKGSVTSTNIKSVSMASVATMNKASSVTIKDTVTVKVGDTELKVGKDGIKLTGSTSTSASIAAAVAKAIEKENPIVEINGVKWAVSVATGSTKLTFEQLVEPTTPDEARANFDVSISITKYKPESKDEPEEDFGITLGNPDKTTTDTNAVGSNGSMTMSASIKVGTHVITPGVANTDANKANTVFNITENDIKDGTKIAIGTRVITLAIGPDSKVLDSNSAEHVATKAQAGVSGYVKLNVGDDLNTALSKISNALGSTVNFKILDKDGAEKQVKFQIGVSDGTQGFPSGLAVQRINAVASTQAAGVTDTGFDLAFDSLDKLAANFKMKVLGVITGGTEGTPGTDGTPGTETKRGLVLQIGDTADSYNQLEVSIEDMHTKALGLDDMKISDQESAAAAVDKIKAAINQVSDLRGTLGATQNRLDHTINNLSVMTENIQDAESTIRDTDVADEMMAYTKNNILIQSAQAMLAQANQVPQGVLQLLQ